MDKQTSTQISQPESTPANNVDYFDPVQDRKDEFLLDALEGEIKHHECFHTPDMLETLDLKDCGNEIIRASKCHCCGEIIKEIFTSSGLDFAE